jgi:NAD(P)-dependent dehydrogenase (short-subunit alcohol dehydrogenase family)
VQENVVLITGANSGIGKETTRALAHQGATLVMACRNLAKAEPVRQAIQEESGNSQIEVLSLDLASLASIREFAGQFSEKYQQLHVLLNNAGTFSMTRQETLDGFELTMGVNHLGTFLLTRLLLPLLQSTPESRIVNVSSNVHYQGAIDLDDLQLERKKYRGMNAYANSKLANVCFTLDLAAQLQDTGVTVNALHPGFVATNIWQLWPEERWYHRLLIKIISRTAISAQEGALTSIYLATSDEVRGVTGQYFDKNRPRAVSPKCDDRQMRRALWQLSEELVGWGG